MKKISIIIPCLNEEKNINKVYHAINKKFHEKNYEIIFVDDNSSDNTQKKIIELTKKNKKVKYIFRKNDKDLSRAFMAGVYNSRAKYIILMDCDLQHDPIVLNDLYNNIKLNYYNCVSGSRFLKKSINNTKQIKYFFRLILSKILNYFINFILNINLSDSLTGFFIIERKLLLQNKKKLFLNGYKIFLDFYACKNMNINHKEIPIKLNERIYGKSKLTLNTLLNIVRLILFKKLN